MTTGDSNWELGIPRVCSKILTIGVMVGVSAISLNAIDEEVRKPAGAGVIQKINQRER